MRCENDDLGTLSRGSLDILAMGSYSWIPLMLLAKEIWQGLLSGCNLGSPVLPHCYRNGQRINDGDSSLHLEGFYQYAISDNISITPGIIVITAPDSSDDNDTLVIGTIRTNLYFLVIKSVPHCLA